MNIKIIGPGCKNCQRLFETTMKIASKINENIEVEHITNISEMIGFGISKSPGMIINGKIVSQGKKLTAKEIGNLIDKSK